VLFFIAIPVFLFRANAQPWLPAAPTPGTSIYNNNGGFVGIGTTTPDALLTVNGSSHLGNDVILTRKDNSKNASIVVDNSITNAIYLQKIGGGSVDYINLLGSNIGLGGNVNIGFGIGSPLGSKVAVWTNTASDGIYLSHDGSSYGGSSGFVKLHGPSLPAGGWNNITANGDAGIIYGTANATTNNGFVIAPWGTGPSGIRLDKSGNVSIGTSCPGTYKLAVEGTIGARKVVVTTSSWCDYVFDRGYHLPSLRQVEAYIGLYHHLPDVPSALEVQEQGLDVGGNQATLLKKIEELTLYAVEQDKKLEAQEKEIDALKAQRMDLDVQRKEIDELKALVMKLMAKGK